MTKREAYARIDKGDLTWGHLKHYIAQCYDIDLTRRSDVNPSMTKRQVLDILERAVEPRDDNELVISPRYRHMQNARNTLMAVNVLRETHFPVKTLAEADSERAEEQYESEGYNRAESDKGIY